MDLHYNLNDEKLRSMLEKAPGEITAALEKSLDDAAGDAVEVMYAETREHDVSGNLRNSIKWERTSQLSRFISPSENYAAAVDRGTGPAAGLPRYFPNLDNLHDLLRQYPQYRGFNLAKPGSKKRETQEDDLWFRAKALGASIYKKGTKPTNFVAKTEEKMKSRFFDTMDKGMAEGISKFR